MTRVQVTSFQEGYCGSPSESGNPQAGLVQPQIQDRIDERAGAEPSVRPSRRGAEPRAPRPPIEVGGRVIAAGQSVAFDVPLPSLYSHAAMSLPIHVVHGRQEGPRLLVCAAVHGDEIVGVEIIRRILRSPLLKRLHGSLVAVPVVNVYGFVNQSRYLPDRRDLNRVFPGSESGSMAARLAAFFLNAVVRACTHGVDIHTAAIHRDNLAQVRACLTGNPQLEAMARAFGAPVILNAPLREGSLRAAACQLGIPMLVYEAGEALRFDEVAIRGGVKGILRVMRTLGMLPSLKPSHSDGFPDPATARSSHWARAPQSGILRALKPLGARVRKNDVIGVIGDPFGVREVEILAPVSGLIIGRANLPLANAGEALFHIARFGEPDEVAEAVEQFQYDFSPETDLVPPPEPPIM